MSWARRFSVLFQCMLSILSITVGGCSSRYRCLSPMVPPRMGSPHCEEQLEKQKGRSCLPGGEEGSWSSWARNDQNWFV